MKALYRLAKAFKRELEGLFIGEGSFQFGNHTISYSIGERSNLVEVYNQVKDIYLDRVADYLTSLIQPCEEEDEWNVNGFRNESDYIRYKFG
jgi:hypothetical protein